MQKFDCAALDGRARARLLYPLFALTLLFGPLSPFAAERAGGLFVAVEDGRTAVAAAPDGALRSRLVKVDHERLRRARSAAVLLGARDELLPSSQSAIEAKRAPDASLRLELFDGVEVRGVVDWTEPTFSGGYSLTGGLVGDPMGSMVLVVNEGRVAGSVDTGGRAYRIRAAGEGLYVLSEVEETPLRCGVDGLPLVDGHVH